MKIATGSTQISLPLKSPRSQQFEEALLLLDVTKTSPNSIQSSPVPTKIEQTYSQDLNGSITNDRQAKHTSDELFIAASLLVQNKLKAVSKKRSNPLTARITNAPGYQRQCNFCQATVTPMWRHGPAGYEDLCNKCGVKWMRGKILRDVAQHPSFANRI